jgi:hypothetical protein
MNPREVEGDSWIRICELELGLGHHLIENQSIQSLPFLPPPKKLHKDQRVYLCDGDVLHLHISHSIYSLNSFYSK